MNDRSSPLDPTLPQLGFSSHDDAGKPDQTTSTRTFGTTLVRRHRPAVQTVHAPNQYGRETRVPVGPEAGLGVKVLIGPEATLKVALAESPTLNLIRTSRIDLATKTSIRYRDVQFIGARTRKTKGPQ